MLKKLIHLLVMLFSTSIYAETDSKLINENLLMILPLPTGQWDVYQNREEGSDLSETSWFSKTSEDMVQVFVLYNMSGGDVKKAKLVDNAIGRENCDLLFESYVISDKIENNYQQLTWSTLCNTISGFYSKAIHKSIAGNDSMYEFKVIFKSEPASSDWKLWTDYISSIKVCDSRIPAQACPTKLEKITNSD